MRRAGWRVSTVVKHAYHDADIDRPGTDSLRHQQAAGASAGQALVGGRRYAIMREEAEPPLAEVLARLAPADLVLIEGYKRERHPKIEVRAADVPSLAANDPAIVAIAADTKPADSDVPWFRRDDIAGIADFIAGRKG